MKTEIIATWSYSTYVSADQPRKPAEEKVRIIQMHPAIDNDSDASAIVERSGGRLAQVCLSQLTLVDWSPILNQSTPTLSPGTAAQS